jgi:hypothetical protein
MALPLINGRAYDYTQIQILIGNVPIVSASSISYSETQEVTNNYGTGDRPVSVGLGAIEAEASIDIAMEDVEALRAESTNGSLLGLPFFDILVVFGNPQNPTTHVLKNAKFRTDGVEAAQGDTNLSRSFDLYISNIDYSLL